MLKSLIRASRIAHHEIGCKVDVCQDPTRVEVQGWPLERDVGVHDAADCSGTRI